MLAAAAQFRRVKGYQGDSRHARTHGPEKSGGCSTWLSVRDRRVSMEPHQNPTASGTSSGGIVHIPEHPIALVVEGPSHHDAEQVRTRAAPILHVARRVRISPGTGHVRQRFSGRLLKLQSLSISCGDLRHVLVSIAKLVNGGAWRGSHRRDLQWQG